MPTLEHRRILLSRPALPWPKSSSVLGFWYGHIIQGAMGDGSIAYEVGWYVDMPPPRGAVWGWWQSQKEWGRIGLGILSAVTSAWGRRSIDIVVEYAGANLKTVAFALPADLGAREPVSDPVEQAIVDVVTARGSLSVVEAIGELHLRGRADAARFFNLDRRPHTDVVAHLVDAIQLTRSMVILRGGGDVDWTDAEQEAAFDVRDQAFSEIDQAVFDAAESLRPRWFRWRT